jgi:putative PEP-CTERM system histidine kinase
VLIIGGLSIAPVVLILLEQLYRNATTAGRYALRYFAIAMGAMFVYDLYLFAQALLLKGVEASSWEARGFINALAVPLIAIAARRNPQWSLNVFVSRQVVFYTTTFLAVGTYLIIMALGGYLIRIIGGTWGRPAQLIFFAGAGIVLVSLLASGNVRRRLRVFLSKHFYRNKYDYRLEWLRFIETLSSPETGVGVRDNCVRAMAQIVASRGGTLFMQQESGSELIATGNWPGNSQARGSVSLGMDDELVAFMRRTQWVVDLDEQRRMPDLYQNVAVPQAIAEHPEWRLAVPLIQQREMLGFVLLERPAEPFELTYEDRDLLKTVGQHVATHLAQHEADRRLAESRQFDAYHRLTAYVMHDLKNLAAQLSLLVANAEKHRRNPDFVDDALSTIANSANRIQGLIGQLLPDGQVQGLNRHVSLAEVASIACERTRVRRPHPEPRVDGAEICVEADPERLAVNVEHLIRNAQDACSDDGKIVVSVRGDDSWAELAVEDNGCGMDAEFVRDRLFKPFDTTKGSKGMGMGAYQVRDYVASVGGRLEVRSEVGIGTRIALRFPRSAGGSKPSRP